METEITENKEKRESWRRENNYATRLRVDDHSLERQTRETKIQVKKVIRKRQTKIKTYKGLQVNSVMRAGDRITWRGEERPEGRRGG